MLKEKSGIYKDVYYLCFYPTLYSKGCGQCCKGQELQGRKIQKEERILLLSAYGMIMKIQNGQRDILLE